MFAGSGASAAGGMAMLFTPVRHNQPGPADGDRGGGPGADAPSELLKRRLGMVAEPYQQGRPGRLMRLASRMTLGAAAASTLGGRSRVVSALCGATLVAASAITRFGVFEAGLESARDPKYTVVPQRERMAAREAATARTPS